MALRFSHTSITSQIALGEDYPSILTIEAPGVLNQILQDMRSQSQNDFGGIKLIENFKELTFSKEAEIVWSPYLIDFGARRLMARVSSDLDKISTDESHYELTGRMQSILEQYFDRLTQDYEIPLVWDDAITAGNLMKAANVRIDTDGLSFTEKLITYMDMITSLRLARVFIFTYLRTIFTDEALKDFYRELRLRKFCCLFLENCQKPRVCAYERHLVVDASLCEIVNDFDECFD